MGGERSLSERVKDFLNLEKQFSFYGAYHHNHTNILIHLIFVWPIVFTALIIPAYGPILAPLPSQLGGLPYHQYMVLNYSFVIAAVYALFHVTLDKKAGTVSAALVLLCWLGSNAVAQSLPYQTAWKVVLVSQVVCWTAQFIGHGVFEKRAPALLDNIAQAFLMAPFFVLLEVLHMLFEYEPYPGFTKKVQGQVNANIAKYRASKKLR